MSLELLGLAGAAVLRLDGGGGLAVALDRASGQYNVTLDGVPWLLSTDTEPATYFGAAPALNSAVASGSELRMTWRDVAGAPLPWRTDIIAPADQPGSLIFRQTFTAGVANTSANVSAACGPVAEGTDQTGGTMIERFENVTRPQCCDRCMADPQCDAFVISTNPTPKTPYSCFLIAGASGSRPRADRAVGRVAGRGGGAAQDSVLAGFPAFRSGAADAALNYIGWGGCQLSPGHGQDDVGTHVGRWSGNPKLKATAAGLTPFLLFDQVARALAVSPATNFFVGVHSTVSAPFPQLLLAGIKASVRSVPAGFAHETLLVAGRGVNDTLVAFGDALLARTGKARALPYDDFVLSHLGHWNDAGGGVA